MFVSRQEALNEDCRQTLPKHRDSGGEESWVLSPEWILAVRYERAGPYVASLIALH